MLTARNATTELQAARRRSGMTLEAIAQKVGHDVSTISRWMSGKQQPDFGQLERLARALGEPITLTFGGPKRAAPPEPWVERLLSGIIALEAHDQITELDLERAQARALVYLAAGTRRRPRQATGAGTVPSAS